MKEWISKEEMIDMIYWAREQEWINDTAEEVLLENIHKLDVHKTTE